MVDQPDGGGRARRTRAEECVLLALEPGRNRELLEEWLAGLSQYRVETVDAEGEIPGTFDLCILDRQSVERYREPLAERLADAEPLYLPVLLTVPEGTTGAATREELVTDDGIVTDVIGLPVEQAALHRRIENLLRARRLSLRLAEREEQYRRLVRLTPEAILLVRDGVVVGANEAAAELFGGPEESATALQGRRVAEFAADDDGGRLDELLATVAEAGRLDGFAAYAFETPGGRIRTEVAGVSVTFGGEPTTQLVVRDVTERKEREQRLTLFERAIEAASQGITVADAQQDDEPLVYANPAFERITGYPLGEILGRNCRFLQGENTDPGTVAEVGRAIDERRPVSVEILNYRKDGTPFWNALDVVPVRDDEGTVTHFVGLQRDVTERKEREQRLAVLDRVLRHDIRNRVNVIQGYAEPVTAAADPSLAEAGERIVDAAEELMALADQVRSFRSVVGSGEREVCRVALARTLTETVAGLEETYPELAVELDLPAEMPVTAHERLPTALRELLELAAGEGDARLSLLARRDEDHWTLDLRDHGRTLPHEDLTVIGRGGETPLDHAQGIEAWLLSWTVEYSGGEFRFDREADPPTVRIRLLPAADEPDDGSG